MRYRDMFKKRLFWSLVFVHFVITNYLYETSVKGLARITAQYLGFFIASLIDLIIIYFIIITIINLITFLKKKFKKD